MRFRRVPVRQGWRMLRALLVGLGLTALTVTCAGTETPAAESSPVPLAEAHAVLGPSGGPARVAAAISQGPAATVEELLEKGLHLAEASPAHLVIRGTPAVHSVRCAWRGVARTLNQRADAIRFWLRLGAGGAIPDQVFLERLFTVVLDTVDPEFRETAKANFLAIARGGESMDYRFLTCFADYAVTNFLLGTGTTPTTVTVGYDRMDEAAAYDLYVREHDTGTYGDALQTRGEYETSLQAQVVAAEKALSDEIGGREAVVFLAPMGAHNAIGFEAWQAVAQWAVVTDDAGVVQAVRDDTPAGDPEHTQTLANLTSRITAAAAGDAHATTRVTTVGGLQQKYRDMGAYGDITPGDGATTTFTPKQPPAAPTCTNGTVISNPGDHRGLVKDCETLLAAKDRLRGAATLNWGTGTALTSWDGVTTGGTPTRVTGLNLASQSLSGTIPSAIGHLFDLTTLNLRSNALAGDIPAELGWLDHLTELRLSGNRLTGCVPLSLQDVATNDLSSVNLPYCQPPAPTGVRAGSPGGTSVPVSWAAVANAGTYRVEVRQSDRDLWTTHSDTITGTSHTVDQLRCATAYQFRVRARGSGTTYATGWSAPSAAVTATTTVCPPPVFEGTPYAFRVAENSAAGTAVGTVTATTTGSGAVTYALTAGNAGEVFAIDAARGALTVAGALDYETTSSYRLTVEASGGGASATAPLAISVTDVATDYDADDDGLLEVASLAQLDAIRWDLDGNGVASDAGYALAFPDPVAGMGCPAAGCTGYELTRDLDFDTDGSGAVDAADAWWDGGAGWTPIGTSAAPFTATFEGNGQTIAHLVIARSVVDGVGLFGATSASGTLRRVRLRAVDVSGHDDVGGLVGVNAGTVSASSAGGQVAGDYRAGGLVGHNTGTIRASFAGGRVSGRYQFTGGLVGRNDGPITTSTASGAVTGATHVGGLAGSNASAAGSTTSPITASYATGTVSGEAQVGGLVGTNGGGITASYATGGVTGTTDVGGLLGSNFDGRITASYWDTTSSGQTASGGGRGQTTSALQTPTDATGIYAAWNVDLDNDGTGDAPWDFGTASQYPALRVDFDGDGTASWREFGAQRPGAPTNSDPVFTDGATTTRAVAENTAADEPFGAPVAATDADAVDRLTYALSGPDAASFELDTTTGQLRTLAALDSETQTSYAVTIEVSDGNGGSASIEVTIMVTDVLDAPSAPTNLVATPAVTSLALTWDPVAGASQYQVDYQLPDAESWTTAADDLTAASHTVADLTCATDYEVQVSAYGDGVAYTAAWGAATAALAVTTTVCPAPTFGAESYTFTVSEGAAVDALVGTVAATTTGSGPVTYAITAGNTGDALAIGETTGQLTVAGALDAATTASYDLTVQASAGGSQATVTVTITVAPFVLTPPPAPANLMATPAATSVALIWDAQAGAARYEVTYIETGDESSTTDADMLTGAAHTVRDLACATAHEFWVRAFGDGVTHTAAWGLPTTVSASTTACGPTPGAASYSFRVSASAGTDTVVGTVTATAAGTGALTYAITAGNEAGAFAIGETTGQLTVAGSLDAASYALTVGVTEAGGGTATVPVSITVTAVPAVTAVTVAFGSAAYATTEGAASGVTVTVALSADPEREVTIPLTVALQDGAEAADYSGVPASVTIASGSTSGTFVVSAVDDTVDDDGESIQLGFGTDLPAGVTVAATEGAVTTTTISLADNDTTVVPFTASLEGEPPTAHDGQTAFTLALAFSETPKSSFSYTTLRDHAFTITGGTVSGVRRLAPPGNVRWEITVQPDGNGDVTVVLPATTDCDADGAVCTEDGRGLSNRLEFTVTGPPAG